MNVRLEMHDGFFGGGHIIRIPVSLDTLFKENPVLALSRNEITQALLITERTQIGDDMYLVREHFHGVQEVMG